MKLPNYLRELLFGFIASALSAQLVIAIPRLDRWVVEFLDGVNKVIRYLLIRSSCTLSHIFIKLLYLGSFCCDLMSQVILVLV